MSKFKCINDRCTYECKLEITGRREAPKMCQYTGQNTHWREVEPANNPEQFGKTEQLPKLTAEVFNRPDCPKDAKIAVVNENGTAYWGSFDTAEPDERGGWLGKGKCSWFRIPGKFDATYWKNSLIQRLRDTTDGVVHVRFKKLHPDAKAPFQATPGSAGFDLTATSVEIKKESIFRNIAEYGTGLAVEIPEGHVGLVFPRSSVYKKDMLLTNGVGVIDSDYRGEIKAVFAYAENGEFYKIGDRIAQLVIMPIPPVKFVEAEELTETQRGAGGYGSTGK